MNSFVKNFIAGGVFCLFLCNSKAVSCEEEFVFPFADCDLVSQKCRQVLEMQPVINSSSSSALPSRCAFPIDTATALLEAAVLAESNEVDRTTSQAALADFLPLLEMGADVIMEAFKFSLSSSPKLNHRRYERDSSVFFINAGYNIPLDDNSQYFIVASNIEEAANTFNAVEKFTKEKPLLPNQIKIVLFNLYDSKMPTTAFNDLYSIVPKKNIVSFILDDTIMASCFHLCRHFHWKKWPGIRITVPLSKSKLFTQEILSDMYDRVLRQWHSRIDTVDLGIFKSKDEAAEGMLDFIGKLPPSASRWNIF